MGVKLYFSNQLLPLALRLNENLMPENGDFGAFDAPTVIVPNMNLSKWLKLTLARHSDVFMNVSFTYLEEGLWQTIGDLARPLSNASVRLDRRQLAILLFFILMALDENEPAAGPLARYLRKADGKPLDDLELRCWQLADEVSRLFQEYEFHRSDMIRAWCDGHAGDGEMETCQSWLYRKMLALKTSLAQAGGANLLTMGELARSLGAPPVGWQCPRVHFFGLSQISPFHIELLSRLQASHDIHIYSLNPSREYWEDIKTPLEKKWIARKNVNRLKLSAEELADGDLFSMADHELLSQWGKPGRENIRLLCQLTDYDFDAGFAEIADPTTVLAKVNHGILTLQGEDLPATAPMEQDTSLQIMACPGVRREVESVYNSILYNLENDPDLDMTDIAVMVPDMARYKPMVDSVFNQMPRRVAYNLVDASARTESLFAQAAMALMALSRGSFSRKAVFAFLQNPCVQKRWGYGPEAHAAWVEWADALGIFHGFENRTQNGSDIPAAGLFSWRQGLERLRLARIMTLPESGGEIQRVHFNGLVPFTDISTGDHRLLEKFCDIVQALHETVSLFKTGIRTASQWRDLFFQTIDRFIEFSDEMHGEETVFQSLVDAFNDFILYDDLMGVCPGKKLSVEALWAFVRSHLEGISGGRGDYLTGGVTVSALMPMRPIPFKLVYVMGLEEGRFPGRASDSLLDLRLRKRRIGDVGLTERNRYLFLEIIISVSGKLYLSYVSRDLQKDRVLEPCSVLHQLKRYLERHVLGGEPFKIRQIPINADSPRYLEPEAVTPWSDVMVNYSPVQRLGAYRRDGRWDRIRERLAPSQRAELARFEPDFSLPPMPEQSHADQPVTMNIGLLRRFLLDPVTVTGQYRLGAFERVDQSDELMQIEEEPLGSCFPVDYALYTLPIKKWLVGALNSELPEVRVDSLDEEFEIVYRDLARRSKVPAGDFADLDRSRFQKEVRANGDILAPLVQSMRSARKRFSAVVLGAETDAGIEDRADRLILHPLDLRLASHASASLPKTIRLEGALPWIWQAEDHTWNCLALTGTRSKSSRPDKYILTPCLTFMAVAASNQSVPWADAGGITVHVGYRDKVQEYRYAFDPKASAQALQNLVGDFFETGPTVWLPFVTVFGSPPLMAILEKEAFNEMDGLSFAQLMHAKMQDELDPAGELYGAVVPDNILELAHRRFGAFLPEPS